MSDLQKVSGLFPRQFFIYLWGITEVLFLNIAACLSIHFAHLYTRFLQALKWKVCGCVWNQSWTTSFTLSSVYHQPLSA